MGHPGNWRERARRLANEEHYARLAAAARSSQTYITPSYSGGYFDEYRNAEYRNTDATEELQFLQMRRGDLQHQAELLDQQLDVVNRAMDEQRRFRSDDRWNIDYGQPIPSVQPLPIANISQNMPLAPMSQPSIAHAIPSNRAPSAPANPSHEAELNRINEQLKAQVAEQEALVAAEIEKRREAERKEASAIKHQSVLARDKHELENQIEILKKNMRSAEDDNLLRIEKMNRQLADMSRANDNFRERLHQSSNEVKVVKEQLISMRFTNTGLHNQVLELRSEASEYAQERGAMAERIARLEEELSPLSKRRQHHQVDKGRGSITEREAERAASRPPPAYDDPYAQLEIAFR